MTLKNKILEAIDRGLDQALQFDLNDYDSDSNDLYISKKKVNLDKQETEIKLKYEFPKYIQLLLHKEQWSQDEKEKFSNFLNANLKYTAKDKEELATLIYCYCLNFGWESDLNWIDVSNITDMSGLFMRCQQFNGDISKWDVSNVENMQGVFYGLTLFNSPIGDWDVSNVTNMAGMFSSNKNFNQPIGGWDVSNVIDMSNMFNGAKQFNQPIGDWNVSNVKNIDFMFEDARRFNQDISIWDVRNAKRANFVFFHCRIREKFKPHFDD